MAEDPYYQDDRITLFQGDVLRVLPEIPSGSIDALVTDPPYSSGGAFRADRTICPTGKYRGFSHNRNGTKPPAKVYPTFGGDNRDQRSFLYWSTLWLAEAYRISRPGAVVLVWSDWRQLPTISDAIQAAGFIWRGILVWDKGVGRPAKGRPRAHVEFILWGSRGVLDGLENPVYLDSVYRVPPVPVGIREHLTQKPEILVRELLALV